MPSPLLQQTFAKTKSQQFKLLGQSYESTHLAELAGEKNLFIDDTALSRRFG